MQNATARVSLAAIRSNAALVRGMCGNAALYAVVKADGYGHGALMTAHALKGIAGAFCVATVDEGAALRIGGVTAPVLVFTPPLDNDDALRLRAYDLVATVADVRSARLCRGLAVHIKVNTGMNRYGCAPRQLPALLKEAENCHVCGVYSHIYAPLCPKDTAEQLSAFRYCARLVKDKYPSAVAHFASTAGILLGGDYLFDAVRCGIGLYGYAPGGFKLPGLIPALKVYAKKVQTHAPVFGGGAGYMRAYTAYKSLSAYRAGYAEGFFRRVPLGVGAPCMDAFVSESDSDELCIMSDAAEYAKLAGTIPYEVLCAVTKRSERVYEN